MTAAGVVTISGQALASIAATLHHGREADRRADGRTGYSVRLPCAMLVGLKSPGSPGHSRSVFAPRAAEGDGLTMADYRRAICVLLILPALLGAAGCCGPWTEPPFETAYSAVGAQVK